MKLLKELKKENRITEDFILECSQELLKKAEVKRAPVALNILASLRDIRGIFEKDIKEAGILEPLPEGGAYIYLRRQDSTKRKRFTCCHEIEHTFFPDYQLKPQQRIDKEVGEYQKNNWVEYLCDLGASELLMPSFLFYPRLSRLGFNLSTLKKLSSEFESSLEATAIKMVRENQQRNAVVIWEEKYKPSEYLLVKSIPLPGFEKYKPKKKLRVRFGYGLENFGHIPNDKSLEETAGIIENSFKQERIQSGEEEINFGNFNIRCEVQSLPLNYQNQKRILTLLKAK